MISATTWVYYGGGIAVAGILLIVIARLSRIAGFNKSVGNCRRNCEPRRGLTHIYAPPGLTSKNT
jgi:hypothetical protein